MITYHIATGVGGNAYQNERVPLLHFTWSNHAKVIKATAPKLALMKSTYSYSACDLLVNLDKTKLKNLNNFKYKFWLYLITYISHYYKKLRRVQHKLIKA